MVKFEEFIGYIKKENFYTNQISYVQHIPNRNAKYGQLERPLKKRVQRWLDNNNIELWTHQAKAINSIRNGENTIIATSTASGKSLCYNVTVLQSILENPETTAIYLFPTKALARDQYSNLSKMLTETNIKQNRLGIYDGDIEANQKRQVLDDANIVITNPYGLHFYLPWFNRKWGRICQNLRYIVLDEVHTYRGIFGSNFALLIRRLKRILDSYGTNPLWILSSATISNPRSFAEKLIGEEVTLVNNDGSPSGAKKVILWDLPY
ncbi:MAG: DEAD/DEAH box helicase, partial [Candidatus Lokiarchaeota archaeon]|nr:DEAD/DEAH box helicase [Candidatus Lokiarchaeota archaeon]MBD3198751.1 DEAD/DEAH box helicase [Candidatus Lokiarchaeota archaeon]